MSETTSTPAPRGVSILMVTGEYPPALGGVGDYAEILCGHLARAGAHVTVLTRVGLDDRGNTGVPADFRVLRSVRRWGPGCWMQVAATAARLHAQVVHIQYQAAAYEMSPAVNALPAFLRARLPRSRVVTTFHDLRVPYLFPKAGPARKAAVRALDRFSHATVVTDQADLDELGGTGGRQRKRWFIPLGHSIENSPPNGYDRDAWRAKIGADDSTLVLSYFGLMNESKGVDLLVDALALLRERGVRARLLIVGGEAGDSDPTNRAYRARVDDLIHSRNLGNLVEWTGFVPPEGVSAALLASDICVLPFRDGVSLRRTSLLAAMVHRLAVVTTLPEGSEPLLRNGVNMAMVPRDDPEAIADAAEYLWRDESRRLQLSAGAAALAEQFRWPDIAAKHLEMYAHLLANRPTTLRRWHNPLQRTRREDNS